MTKLSIQLRIPNDDGTADYRVIFGIRTAVPPSIGDRMEIHSDSGWTAVKVIKRRWSYPVFGSGAWPYDSPSDFVPEAFLDIIVEKTDELFADEREGPPS